MEDPEQHQDKGEIKPKSPEQNPSHDVVFGEITEEGPNYRNVCIDW
jgi:hypothetical protein